MMRPFPDLQKKVSSCSQNGLLLQQNDQQIIRSHTHWGEGHTYNINLKI